MQMSHSREQIHRLAGKEVLLWVGGQTPQHRGGSVGQVGLQSHIRGMWLGWNITDVPTGSSLTMSAAPPGRQEKPLPTVSPEPLLRKLNVALTVERCLMGFFLLAQCSHERVNLELRSKPLITSTQGMAGGGRDEHQALALTRRALPLACDFSQCSSTSCTPVLRGQA